MQSEFWTPPCVACEATYRVAVKDGEQLCFWCRICCHDAYCPLCSFPPREPLAPRHPFHRSPPDRWSKLTERRAERTLSETSQTR